MKYGSFARARMSLWGVGVEEDTPEEYQVMVLAEEVTQDQTRVPEAEVDQVVLVILLIQNIRLAFHHLYLKRRKPCLICLNKILLP